MNTLEKILEEIENEAMTNKEIGRKQCEGMARAMNIIRSHMVEKERVTSAKIISREIDGRPYYEIKFKKVGEDEYTVGYGSYKFGYVVKWLNDYFEFCGEAKVSFYNDGWIPVEDRLPEVGTYVICCFDDGTVDVLWQNWKEDEYLLFYSDVEEIRKVIAWQPLPAPYKGV